MRRVRGHLEGNVSQLQEGGSCESHPYCAEYGCLLKSERWVLPRTFVGIYESLILVFFHGVCPLDAHSHPNMLGFITVNIDPKTGTMSMISEFMANGSIMECVHANEPSWIRLARHLPPLPIL